MELSNSRRITFTGYKNKGENGQIHTMLQLEINKTHHNRLIQCIKSRNQNHCLLKSL
jgi:hypothetical protein